jgi:hypothetical protein
MRLGKPNKNHEVLCYFDDFLDDAGMVGPDIGYDFCHAEFGAVFRTCAVFVYCWFPSLVSVI